MFTETQHAARPVASTGIEVEEVGAGRFWERSRFKDRCKASTLPFVAAAAEKMVAGGGFASFLEATRRGRFAGSLMAFHDPAYRSHGRAGVGAFGLVTATSKAALAALVHRAVAECGARGLAAVRGPVNVPRSLHGYGVSVRDGGLPAIAGVSSDPPALARWLDDLQAEGTFSSATTYNCWTPDAEKTRRVLASRGALDGGPGPVHPDLDAPRPHARLLAEIFNETMHDRPDTFVTDEETMVGHAALFSRYEHGREFIAFFEEAGEVAGCVVLQPDWFQLLAGEPVTRFVQDTMATRPGHRGKALFAKYVGHCMGLVARLRPEHFEYIYTVRRPGPTEHYCTLTCERARELKVYEATLPPQ